MRKVIFSMGMSLDGYIVGPDGRFDWGVPDRESHQFSNDEVRGLSAHVLGRRLYETMAVWEDPEFAESEDPIMADFASVWNPLPKVVFSRTLDRAGGSGARLATGTLAEEIARLREAPGDGDIAIGGATLAQEAAGLGLIDEYHIMIHPVLVGGGIPFFAHDKALTELELIETRTFGSRIVYLAYRVVR